MSIVRVAKHAGVSVATVSRVLNDLKNVRAETVEQVKLAIQELNYTPPAVRRGPRGVGRRVLRSGMKTGQVAVLNLGGTHDWLGMPVMASVVGSVMRAAKAHDVNPVLDEMPDPTEISGLLRRREVDGAIVFMPAWQSETHLETLARHLPVVWLMGAHVNLPSVDHVSVDNAGIGRLAFQYLHDQGCRRVAFASTDAVGLPLMRARGQAFGNAARDAKLSVTNFLCDIAAAEADGFAGRTLQACSIDELADQIAETLPQIDGLFVSADRTTTALYPRLISRGIQPERDLRIISCDNEIEQLAALHPCPPSIDLNGDALGEWAVRQLMHRLQHPKSAPARIQVIPRIGTPRIG